MIRHGKSQWTDNSKVSYEGFRNWIDRYDSSSVFESDMPYPARTLEKINKANLILSSDLKRSIDSAKILTPDFTGPSYPLFREIEFPAVPEFAEKVKLPPTVWAVFLRVSWFAGYAKGAESYKKASQRAGRAADVLVNEAVKHESVVLVGHGFFNFLIAKQLQKRGWEGRRNTSFEHWVANTYRL